MSDRDDEFVKLYDDESGNVLFEDVARDAVEELSSPGPKDDLVAGWLRDATQVASDAELRRYVKSSGATVDRDVNAMREKAFWIACCARAEDDDFQEHDEGDDDVEWGDEDEDA